MLHIILVILKALGVLLAAVLLLILFVLLLLLFVPVRYRIKGSYLDEEKRAKVQVTWLLHLISFRLSYVFGEKPDFLLKIFGIQLFPKPENEETETKSEADTGTKHVNTIETAEKTTDHQPKAVKEPEPAGKVPKTVTENEISKVQTALDKEITAPKKGVLERIQELFDKIKAAISAFREKIRTIFQKITEIKLLIKHYLDILKEEETKALIKSFRGYILYILKHYAPGKIKGYIQYGLKDPSQTGQLTGLLYIILPAAMNDFELRPVFETDETIIRGEVDMRGHVRLCHILYIGLRLLFDKNLKHVLKRIKK